MVIGLWGLGFPPKAVACAVLKHRFVLNPAVIEFWRAKEPSSDFWFRLLNDEQLKDCDNFEKIVIGCELIAALDAAELLAA